VKITGFSIKMAAILDFRYFVHVYASNSGGISQENDLIHCIFVSIRPDSNVNLPRPTYIHSLKQSRAGQGSKGSS
jgi:hypothetical protein